MLQFYNKKRLNNRSPYLGHICHHKRTQPSNNELCSRAIWRPTSMRDYCLKTIVRGAIVCGVLGSRDLSGYRQGWTGARHARLPVRQHHRRSDPFYLGPSPYRTKYAQAKAALAELGIRHIRDSVGNTSANAVFRDLGNNLGVKLCAVVDARTGSGASTRLANSQIAATLSRAKSQIGTTILKAIEGPNEYNQLERDYGYQGWAQELRSYQTELRRQVKADPVLKSLPVIAPSMADPMQASYYTKLGNLSGSIDRGNAHVYPNWLSWDQKIKQVTPYARISAPTQPIWTTETGWHMAFNSGAQWVPEDVLIKYLPGRWQRSSPLLAWNEPMSTNSLIRRPTPIRPRRLRISA
ncbi:MAG: hypothetical protein HWD60_10525 [Defluviicoccus sp.]|nr:MAG: hypothetical protein HWD60_10525 [Defluviicoccus sp.]